MIISFSSGKFSFAMREGGSGSDPGGGGGG